MIWRECLGSLKFSTVHKIWVSFSSSASSSWLEKETSVGKASYMKITKWKGKEEDEEAGVFLGKKGESPEKGFKIAIFMP